MKQGRLHPLVTPTRPKRLSDDMALMITNPATALQRAIRAANALLNPDAGVRRADDVDAAAAYVSNAWTLLRTVNMKRKKDSTPKRTKLLREQLRAMEGLTARQVRQRLGVQDSDWPSDAVISRERKALKKARIPKS